MHQTLHIENKPFGIFVFWLGLTTLFWWNFIIVKEGIYNLPVLMPFVNFLSFVILYQGIVRYLTIKDLEKMLKCLQYVIGIMVFYAVLQKLNLDQFHKPIDPALVKIDAIIGTLGNPIHLAGWLSITLPILYYNTGLFSNISIILVWLVLILTGSASGLMGAIFVTIFYNLFHKIRIKFEGLVFALLAFLGLFTVYKIGFDKILYFFNPSGRIAFWGKLYEVFREAPITGKGLGILNTLGLNNGLNISVWRHAHQEYFQIAVETGIIGLVIVLWGIFSYFRLFTKQPKDKLTVCLATIFVGFLVNCLFNYPAHMWLTGTFGIFAYSGLFVIKGETL